MHSLEVAKIVDKATMFDTITFREDAHDFNSFKFLKDFFITQGHGLP